MHDYKTNKQSQSKRCIFANKGSSGVDKLSVDELADYLKTYGNKYILQIKSGTYQVNPILGVEIDKDNGKKRLLGIPTVVDRTFQQALHQIL